MRNSRGARTARNYKDWLTPFVGSLEAQAAERPVVVTSNTIKAYLKQCGRYNTYDSFNRAGTQIVSFVN